MAGADSPDVLLVVEDPGAANYAVELPAALEARGSRVRVAASGASLAYLASRNVEASAFTTAEDAVELLDEARPRLLLVGTSGSRRPAAHALIVRSRDLGVPTVAFVDARGNPEHRFRGDGDDPLAYAPDWLVVPDEWTRDAFAGLGFPAGRLLVCGHPLVDRMADRRAALADVPRAEIRARVFPALDAATPVVVFLGEEPTELNTAQYERGHDYTLVGRGTSTDRVAIVLEEVLDALSTLEPRPHVVYRLHPRTSPESVAGLAREVSSVSQGGDPLDLLAAADLVVGLSTTLLLEAALLGLRTLSVLPLVAEQSLVPSIELGLTPCVTTRDELRRTLPQLLGPSDPIEPAEPLSGPPAVARLVAAVERVLAERPPSARGR